MSGKTGNHYFAVFLIALLAGWPAAEAFSFCFSFGGGGKNRGDFYNRPSLAAGFDPGAYYAYRHSPVYPAPSYIPYYPAPLPPGYYGSNISRPLGPR